MNLKRYFALLLLLLPLSCLGQGQMETGQTYENPIIGRSLPDPTVIRVDNEYYLYATENIRNVPIYKSSDLVHWTFVGTAFDEESRPRMVPDGGIWAPEINYVDGKYHLYYSKSKWGGEWECGIGVAVSDSPEGPFVDAGKIFTSNEIEVQNSIDPFFIEDGGRKYLFWGSLRGLWATVLSDDGLSLAPDGGKVKVAGNGIEGVNIYKKDGYYYLFASEGSCCEGAASTYHVVCGRSADILGPYVTKDGEPLLSDHYDTILTGDDIVAGPGHNSRLVLDDEGTGWMIYHGYLKSNI